MKEFKEENQRRKIVTINNSKTVKTGKKKIQQ